MNLRENFLAALHYEKPERLPILSFGYWTDTTEKWAEEGYITRKEAGDYAVHGDGGWGDASIRAKLGFDWGWSTSVSLSTNLKPLFEEALLETKPDGSRIIRNSEGLLCAVKPGITSIPSEIGTGLTGREAWEKEYLPKLQYSDDRVPFDALRKLGKPENSDIPQGLFIGSLIGNIRNYLGVENLSYLWADDETLYREIVDTVGNLCCTCTKKALETGARFDFAHFWEDICFKNGPLVSPAMFREVVGPWYKKITDLLHEAGTEIVSLDCDGCVDALLPIWLENGVNTMFPIEVGTWNASIAPWREKYGRQILGVGGINKTVFAADKAAVEAEAERVAALTRLGGFVPCVDHRIAPDAKFELVQYFCTCLHQLL